MLRDILQNPLSVLHAFGLTFLISIWTIVEMAFYDVPRQAIDRRLRWWARHLLKRINLQYNIHNPHQVTIEKDKAYIIMCNHSSHYDIPLSLLALPGSIRMLAKKELLGIPIWGKAMRLSEFVSIDRNNPRQALKDMKYAKEKMENGILLWIAPEGTRSKNGELLPFKPGGFRLAIECGATIIPLGIVGTSKVLAAKSFAVTKNSRVDMILGKPIAASSYSKQQRNRLMSDVEQEIHNLLQVQLGAETAENS